VAWRQLGSTSLDTNQGGNASAAGYYAPNAASGAADAYADRTYDDGFVKIGAATAGSGLTTNFGYASDSQVASDTLTYTLTGGAALDTPNPSSEDDSTEAAPYLEAVYYIPLRDDLELGLVTSFSFTNLDSSMQSQLTEYGVTTIDHYALNGVILPSAPYSGSYAGPGVVIDNQPSSREQVLTPISTRTYRFDSEIDLYSLGLGGELNWTPAERCFLNLGAGAVINYVDWSADLHTPLLTGTSHQHESDQKFLFGLYLKAGAGYQLTEAWSLEAFTRYDWNENLHGHVGEADFTTDLSGWTTGLALGYRF
jgi:opacity protein-like surface antigen